MRVSDAEREEAAERLRVAAGSGRLNLQELEQRLEQTYAARTYGELEPLILDLPSESPDEQPVAHRDTAEIRQTGTNITRRGRWKVPRRLVVEGRFGVALLDFSEAIIDYPEVEIVLAKEWGSTRIIVPKGAAVDTDELEMAWGSLTNTTASVPERDAPHFRITGSQQWGSVTIRYPRRLSGRLTGRRR